MSAQEQLDQYIDLDRYPIDDLDSDKGMQFIADCQQMMDQNSICILPNFLRPEAVVRIADELTKLAGFAHPMDQLRTPYGWMDNSGFEPDHPRSALFKTACGVLTTDQFTPNSHSQILFQFDQLTDCIRRMLGLKTFYRSACPTLSIQANVLNEGQTFGWHYDTNDGVVSFIIQEADEGGTFELVPKIRAEDDENYTAVKRIFDETDKAQAPAMPAGTFTLFLGRRSVHRVAPVGKTKRPRLSLLFSYDQKPNMRFPQKTCQTILNPSPEPYLGALTPM